MKWGLSVNINKTKGMTLSLGNSKMLTFTLNNEILENVSNYKYLGIIIHKNGKFNKAISERMSKSCQLLHQLHAEMQCRGNPYRCVWSPQRYSR